MDYLHVQADNPWYNYYLLLVVTNFKNISRGLFKGQGCPWHTHFFMVLAQLCISNIHASQVHMDL